MATESFERVVGLAKSYASEQDQVFDESGFRAFAMDDYTRHKNFRGYSNSIFNEPGRFQEELFRVDPFLSAPAPPAPTVDPIATALDQLANIFKPPPPAPSPPAPVRQSVDATTPSVERRRVDFGSFAARVSAPSGSDFSKRRPTLGAGL